MTRTIDRRAGWRARACAYGAAVVLNLALVSGAPVGVLPDRTPIVRPAARRGDGFDPCEVVDGMVLTVAAEVGCGSAPSGGDRFGLN